LKLIFILAKCVIMKHFLVEFESTGEAGMDYEADSNGLEKEFDSRPGPNCQCGRANLGGSDYADYIIGGHESRPHAFPWMVRIEGGCAIKRCAGTIISPRILLTAFHCTYNNSKQQDKKPCDHSDEKRLAYFGVHTITKENKKEMLSIPIIDVKYPPSAGLKEKDFDSHDLAILVLKFPLDYSSTIRPICLPKPGEEFYGRSVTAAGWGMTDKDSGQSKVLNVVQLRVSEKRYKHHKMFGTELSKFENKYRDPCSGDSGGPLMQSDNSGRYRIIGTVYGRGYDCRTGNVKKFEGAKSGVWSSIPAQLDWVKDTMAEFHTECRDGGH